MSTSLYLFLWQPCNATELANKSLFKIANNAVINLLTHFRLTAFWTILLRGTLENILEIGSVAVLR